MVFQGAQGMVKHFPGAIACHWTTENNTSRTRRSNGIAEVDDAVGKNELIVYQHVPRLFKLVYQLMYISDTDDNELLL